MARVPVKDSITNRKFESDWPMKIPCMILCCVFAAGCGMRAEPVPAPMEVVKKPIQPHKHRVKLENIVRVSDTESTFAIKIDLEP